MGLVQLKYKQTEIGIIPDNWALKTYDEVFQFLSTATYSRAELSDNEDVGYIHYGDIHTKWNHHLNISKATLPTVNRNQLKQYHLIKEGDLIVADASEDYSGLGKSVEVMNLGTQNVISGLHTFLLREKDGDFIKGYKAYIHSIATVKKQFDELATGMKVYGISKNNLKKIRIPIPTKAEQTAIATALSDADAFIISIEKLISKKRSIKAGAMQELLKPKKGWILKKLGEIAEVIGGATPSTFNTEYWNGNVNWFTPSEIGVHKYTYESVRKITEAGFQCCSARMLPIGTILLTSRAGIGDLSILMKEGCTNQGFQSLVVKEFNSFEFIYYLMHTLKYVLLQNASGSTFLEISPNKIKQIEVSIPSLKEQLQIATILSDMDSEIDSLEKKLTKAIKIKQGMMQQLLTGKIRLI